MKLKIIMALIAALCCFFLYPFDRHHDFDVLRFDAVDVLVRIKSHIIPKHSSRSLKAKLKDAPAPWIQKRMTQDLAHLKNQSITSKDLEAYMAQFSEYTLQKKLLLVRFTMKDGELHYYPKTMKRFKGRFEAIKKAMRTLHQENLLPQDLDFILCMRDKIFDEYKGEVPLFIFSKDIKEEASRSLILMPDGINLSRWSYVRPTIKFASWIFPWSKKEDNVLWRGSDTNPMRVYTSEVLNPKLAFLDAALTTGRNNAYMIPEHQIKSKYLLSLDGISSTWPGLIWKLASNCLVLKQSSTHIQWYYEALKPYEHFVPVSADLSNLETQYLWAKNNPGSVERIIKNARTFTENELMYEDMLHYMARILKVYQPLIQKV